MRNLIDRLIDKLFVDAPCAECFLTWELDKLFTALDVTLAILRTVIVFLAAVVVYIGDIRLKHLALAAYVLVMVPIAIGIFLLWYVPIIIVSFAGRRARLWSWQPF